MRAAREEVAKETEKAIEKVKEVTDKVAWLEIEILATTENPISLAYPVEPKKMVERELRKHFEGIIQMERSVMRGLSKTFEDMIKIERSSRRRIGWSRSTLPQRGPKP